MIEHIFVVMLENRSFDQLLGFSGLQGQDPAGNATKVDGLTGQESNISPTGERVTVSSPAEFLLDYGPGHEFKDVQEQLCGKEGNYSYPPPKPGETDEKINNSGYISNYSHYDPKNPEAVMRCFSPSQMPVLTTLAKEFAVCDRWFSSMPGPTWPNRFFVHAASSGGLDDSPSFTRTIKSILYDGFKFDNGTIFDLLDNAKRDWTIYSDDEFPQALSIAGMHRQLEKHFRPFKQFKTDVSDPLFSKSYVFIEPDYHAFTGRFRGGNSQHPVDDVTSGEKFLKEIYEAIRASPNWEKSALIITYDEHGGFYDHVVPPTTVHPGDSITSPGNNHNNFNFQQLGVRVPTVIVSPFVPKGTIDHSTYDHTSILATVETLFKLGGLTKRDRAALNFTNLFRLKDARQDIPSKLPAPAVSGYVHKENDKGLNGIVARLASLFNRDPVDPSLRGFHHVALLRHMKNKPETEKDQLVNRFLRHRHYQAVRYLRRVRSEVQKS